MRVTSNTFHTFEEKVANHLFSQRPSLHLLANAYWLHLKHLYDPLSVSAIGRVDPLPHQLSAFRSMINRSIIRVLVADDVGLGKTVTIGLLLKELILQDQLQRCLIVVPAVLQLQWQEELEEKFLLPSAIAGGKEGRGMFASPGVTITSLQYLRRIPMIELLEHQPKWDLVVFDEAHALSPGTNSYDLAEVLSKRTKHLLLLTATPHDGKTENFVGRLRLLDSTVGDSEGEIRRAVEQVMIRRIKSEVRDFHGQRLFPNEVITHQVSVEWTQAELNFYHEAEYYIENYFLNPETGEQYKTVTFILLVLMRRLASSLQAGQISLNRRLAKLDARLQDGVSEQEINELEKGELPVLTRAQLNQYLSAIDEGEDDKAEELAYELSLAIISGHTQILRERGKLLEVIELVSALLESEIDSKSKKLLSLLEEFRAQRPQDKIIIFTEFTDTLDHLFDLLDGQYTVYCIHGKLSKEEKKAQTSGFWDDGDILLGTRAAGEGLNLQCANVVINYEMPWNPNRLQQRIGRVYRYGQDPNKPIYVFNFTSTFTIEKLILEVLHEKIERIRSQIGEIGVELLGTMISQSEINDLIYEALRGKREDAKEQVDHLISEKRALIDDILSRYLISNSLEPQLFTDDPDVDLAQIVTASDIERLVLATFAWHDIYVNHLTDSYMIYTHHLPSLPSDISVLQQVSASTRLNTGFQRLPTPEDFPIQIRFTFTKEKTSSGIDCILLGHPLLTYCLNFIIHAESSSITLVWQNRHPRILIYILRILSLKNEDGDTLYQEPYIEAFNPDSGKISFLTPLQLWEFEVLKTRELSKMELQIIQEEISTCLTSYEDHFLGHQPQPIDVIGRGQSSTSYRYQIQQNLCMDKYDRLLDKTRQEIANAEQQYETYQLEGLRARQARLQREAQDEMIKLEQLLSNPQSHISDPLALMIGIPRSEDGNVLTPNSPSKHLLSFNEISRLKREVELAGMAHVMVHERAEGRVPEDVSEDYSLGYDVFSRDPEKGHNRWIEVKSFKGNWKNPLLSSNEMRVAREYPRVFYLYVVYNALTTPHLITIPNPAKNLASYITEEIQTTRVYKVNYEGIKLYSSTSEVG